MGNYLISFIVYSMAMVGFLVLCVMIYKRTMPNNRCAKNNQELEIENALNLSQRKTLYVIKAGNEKFLIAADAERTSFLAKLDAETTKQTTQEKIDRIVTIPVEQDFLNNSAIKNAKPVDYSEIMSSLKNTRSNKKPVMREMLRKLSEPILKD